MKPAIGITLSMRRKENSLTLSRDNADAVLAAGGIPFLLPYATEADVLDGMTKQIDGLLLTGGDDIDPSLFGEEPLPGLGEVEPERDRMEIALARRMVKAGKPVLAICRGCQILCIALGGDMYQDLYSQREDLIQHVQRGPREYLSHSIQIREGTLLSQIAGADRIRVNSFHHQAVRRLPDGVILSATAPDGVTEAFEGSGSAFVMGVQWHPENLFRTDAVSRRLFHTFVGHARKKTAAR
ncbi:gamma-glutamyl-gamma-aminobutyrate hydrolase family protein [Kroppenstedtia eburnea]|uniref:Putative glutamine amidotransferase n=1 Tax=Kroppenstedtia eburnea TaxID=714067 RepID=A0A1N7J7D5_9BACL|nr:gamma-glutamyl-gamma-aminobutyrate hydrolase family protein [Kroppenstedtia eburnea]QKI82570.1 gamma-glutamyl-gamma-aminobutyrate hydrolase family protein [Kroppenstedtia eburnea]SIS45177.1 putative glutamine amidotransferase [Kroppenstedtia eburnea]